MKPRLLDLFCGAGGCAKGYQRAGFYVVGVDHKPQPNYCGDEFIQADALDPPVFYDEFDAIHVSPPCQFATDYIRTGLVGEHENLIPETRRPLEATGLPYVIENVTKARPHLIDPVELCGTSFGLDVKRHRLFETTFPVMAQPCSCGWQEARFSGATNRKRNSRRTVEIGVWRIPLPMQKRAMGVDWDVTLEELSQMVPPAYTEHIGHYLMAEISARAAA